MYVCLDVCIDWIGDEKKSEMMYKIFGKNCKRVFVGETDRPLDTRLKEHRKKMESISGDFNRAERARAARICNKSAITDHICNQNHVIDWENVKLIDYESDKTGRLIRDAVRIRKKRAGR